jgi:hypothetical protein
MTFRRHFLLLRGMGAIIHDALEPGGVILVDDVTPDCRWDGAHQVYVEFRTACGLPHERVGSNAVPRHGAASPPDAHRRALLHRR